MAYSIRDLNDADLDEIVRLNNAAVPAVPRGTADELASLVEAADHALAVTDDAATTDRPVALTGLVIAFGPGRDYASENYRFFEDRGTDHLYVDRIIVDEAVRGRSIGQLMYDRVFTLARAAGRSEVTCEVNVEPPNPRSLAFHARLGFHEVGRQITKDGSVEVALLAASARSRTVSAAGPTVDATRLGDPAAASARGR